MSKRRDYTVLAAEKEVFAEWLATPVELRRPSTMTEFARMVNISRTTIRQWSTDYRILRRQSELMADKIIQAWPAVLEAIIETATDKANPRQIQAAKFMTDWYEQTQVEESLDVEALSNEQLRQMAVKLYDAAGDQAQAG